MITFAYDGTISGGWVFRCAVRLSSRDPQRRLRLVLVDEERLPREGLGRRVGRIGAQCERAGVALESAILPREGASCCRRVERELPHRILHGSALERVLRDVPRDVAVYRGLP